MYAQKPDCMITVPLCNFCCASPELCQQVETDVKLTYKYSEFGLCSWIFSLSPWGNSTLLF